MATFLSLVVEVLKNSAIFVLVMGGIFGLIFGYLWLLDNGFLF